MNFTKTILNLILLCSIAQAANSSNNQHEKKVPKQRSMCSSICSCVTKVVTVAMITATVLVGNEMYKSYALEAELQNLPNELTNCMNSCKLSNLNCYDTCAKKMFFPEKWTFNMTENGSDMFDDYYKQNRRHYLRKDYENCLKHHQSCERTFNSQECALAVIAHSKANPNSLKDKIYDYSNNEYTRHPKFYIKNAIVKDNCPDEIIKRAAREKGWEEDRKFLSQFGAALSFMTPYVLIPFAGKKS